MKGVVYYKKSWKNEKYTKEKNIQDPWSERQTQRSDEIF